jgi:hypothetical protein
MTGSSGGARSLASGVVQGRDVNQNQVHRGVRFAVTRVSRPDDAPEYRWTIYPEPCPPEGAGNSIVDGPRAFLRAYKAAQAAIDAWLSRHPATG